MGIGEGQGDLFVRQGGALLTSPPWRAQVIEAIKGGRVVADGRNHDLSGAGPCEACDTPSFGQDDMCVYCGWERGRRCAETTKRKYLIALACAAVWGIRALPCLQGMRFAGECSLHAVRHLARHPEQAKTIVESVGSLFAPLGDWGKTQCWPWSPWPRPRQGNFCTEFSPQHIMSALLPLEAEAWEVFRRVRWPEAHGLCPNEECQQRVVKHGQEKRKGPGAEGVFYYRWFCESLIQRAEVSARRGLKRREADQDHEMVRRRVPIHRRGCGRHFSDITNTPFKSRVPMVHWLLLLVGDVYAIEVLLASGVPFKRLISMICKLDEFSKREPELIRRWKTHLLGIFQKVRDTCESMAQAVTRAEP